MQNVGYCLWEVTLSSTIPPLVLNQYLWAKLKAETSIDTKGYRTTVPFFPVFDSTSKQASWENRVYVVWDVMARFQQSPFYPIRREHVLYSVRGPVDKVMLWRDFIIKELDRSDDAGKDVNAWAGLNTTTKVFFHDIRSYQSEFNRDATRRAFSGTNPYYASEIIVDYRFHIND